ncbi:type 1 glutamine amidotransferase [Patescibacteria group bacterium AH-259-L07]|nr:type 1 glutamine amidotransferase [Patescibacteria group bacterium AH-259-L07]
MNNKKLQLLFLDILTDDLKLKKEEERAVTEGPLVEIFRRKLGLTKNELIAFNVCIKKLPSPENYHGIIIGASLANPIKGEEKPWMKKVYTFIRKTISHQIPLLGICGGHQFVVRAIGGEIIYNPNGREFGTIPLTLTKDGMRDPLFRGVSENFLVQSSHKCMVKNINMKGKLLASSDLCAIQALAINNHTRTVQFHPELSVRSIRALAKRYKETLIKENFVTPQEFKKLLLSIKKTGQTEKILLNFLNYFVLPNKK